ncbi:PTS cellobiose-specific IIC component, putative [Babesia ovata]|uniref:PTS cellobiose-specific IIC component, putative n=1 Tax=Babesia ovata TaxID=189622 RepID=A0A2H6K6F8_9APIC|nr:PTS cellobiose-specific IIC component, putative [Babesia ovata]GBE58568.1 PTS cellobiose-specific IIC component, putative [Babesia ovata]
MSGTRHSTRNRRQTTQLAQYDESPRRPVTRSYGRGRRGEKWKQSDSKSGIQGAHADKNGSKKTVPEEPLEEEDAYMCDKLGINHSWIKDDMIYLEHLNEFATLQELTNKLEHSTELPKKEQVKDTGLCAVMPFANLISPGFSNHYSTQYEAKPFVSKCSNVACATNYKEVSRVMGNAFGMYVDVCLCEWTDYLPKSALTLLQVPAHSRAELIYVTPRQMYAIITTILGQVLRNSDEIFGEIDWKAVSIESHLPVSVCKEFWWGFDITHIKGKQC